jgi:hypothetical protein
MVQGTRATKTVRITAKGTEPGPRARTARRLPDGLLVATHRDSAPGQGGPPGHFH